ncbi:MAG: copper transport protein [Bogoriella megaspora]|nr:MAG: copper transport protein [Bogoriella megaspora]
MAPGIAGEGAEKRIKAFDVGVRLTFTTYITHFRIPGYIRDSILQKQDVQIIKEALRETAKVAEVRAAIGGNTQFWDDLHDLYEAASPSLERRSFAATDPAAPDYEAASGTLIASNAGTLLKDIDRLNDATAIGRNVLTIGPPAQDLAIASDVHRQHFKLISIAIRVTARGYDGDTGTQDEEKWQMVVNNYKKFLITGLQFLNNITAANESCKEPIWADLFDPIDLGPDFGGSMMGSGLNDDLAMEQLLKLCKDLIAEIPPIDYSDLEKPTHPYVLYEQHVQQSIENSLGKQASSTAVRAEGWRRWRNLTEEERKPWELEWISAHYKSLDELSEPVNPRAIPQKQDEIAFALYMNRLNLEDTEYTEQDPERLASYIVDKYTGRLNKSARSGSGTGSSFSSQRSDSLTPQLAVSEDYKVVHSADEGARILQEGKDSLMRQIESEPPLVTAPPGTAVIASPTSPQASPPVLSQEAGHPDPLQYEGVNSEEEENSDDDYDGLPGEEGRGLLTDVPLILGPTEIDVLPIFIMSSIVAPFPNAQSDGDNQQLEQNRKAAIRCQRLLAYDNGRNLLRELLIFVAAWDLREDELYYKLMTKIMEAILVNGLMDFAYDNFKDSRSKDVISPAQAVVIKLLSSIFKARQGPTSTVARQNTASGKEEEPKQAAPYPYRFDVVIVRELFIEFRRRIIPRTCGLIFLQGNIRNGKAHPEEFPINLWDMERMYEGVYQYLEFFAVLTEHDTWKNMMIEWEIISELVTLLKDLDFAIPKGQLAGIRRSSSSFDVPPPPPPPPDDQNESVSPPPPPPTSTPPPSPSSAPSWPSPIFILPSPLVSLTPPTNVCRSSTQQGFPPVLPVAIERPYDTDPGASSTSPATAAGPSGHTTYSPDVPLAYPEDVEEPTDEPSEYSWRNLKKITVLVITSLVWKARAAQDQVRKHGGIEAILNCTQHDEYNPYIREHAIMCLRFLLDGNKENQDVVRALEAKGFVPSEVLDKRGYEPWVDERGRVGLRRKEGQGARVKFVPGPPPPPPPAEGEQKGSTKPNVGMPKLPAEQAAERILKENPGASGSTQGRYDPEKAAALAKLDKRFEEGK